MASANFLIQAEFWGSCRDSWNLSSRTTIVPIHVSGWGKMHHGINHHWILVMVLIDVTDFDAGCWHREVLGFYMNYFPLMNGKWQLCETK
jgi:hypothetical protein